MSGINALLGTDEEAMLAVQEARRTCGELGVEIGTHRRRSSTGASVLRSPLPSQLLRRLSLGSTASSSRAESSCAESSQSSCEGSSCEPSPCAAYQPPNTDASFMHTAYLHHLARSCTLLTSRRLPGSSQRTVHRRASAPVDSRRAGHGLPPGGTVSAPSPHPPGVHEVVLDGCQAGVGLGLDDHNRVTMLEPSGRAAVSGLFGLGDRIVTVDGQMLGNRQLQMLLQVKERHVFGVERLGTQVRASDGFDWDSDDEEGTEARERLLSSPMSKVVRLQSVDL